MMLWRSTDVFAQEMEATLTMTIDGFFKIGRAVSSVDASVAAKRDYRCEVGHYFPEVIGMKPCEMRLDT